MLSGPQSLWLKVLFPEKCCEWGAVGILKENHVASSWVVEKIPLKGILGLQLLPVCLLCFLAIEWAVCSSGAPAMMLCLPTGSVPEVKPSWMNTSKTVSQK